MFSIKRHVVFNKTTRHFPQNDTLFSIKWHDVFYKTTRCFQQNHTSLSIKRYVVLGMMKYFQFHPLWHLWQQKTPSTGARIRARVRTPSVNPKPSPHSIKSNSTPFRTQSTKTFTCEEIFISNETTIDKSAMKQPTTNQDSTPNQYSFALLTNPFRKAKMAKRSIDKEKTAQICRFFTLWGYFYPYIIGGKRK